MKKTHIPKLILSCLATASLFTLTGCETLDDYDDDDDDDDDDDRRYRGASTTTTTEETTLRRTPILPMPGQISTTTETQTTRSY